ncbi:MAG TPA: hypothetical protein VMF58_01600 [Rhizomicrobium sp.]|nr:hypothetical protein [Rhizomicrobium sp.]
MIRPLATILFGLVLGSGAAAAGTCDAIMNGQLKGLTVPTRVVNTDEMNGMTMSFENIVADGTIYTHTKDGSWKAEKQSANEASIRKAWTDKDTCEPAGTEAVDGEMADVVAEHINVANMPMDSKFWISRKSGQILKSLSAMPTATLTVRYYYDNIQVPSAGTLPAH